MTNNPELHFLYDQVIKVWQNFCSLHTDLYEITCEEYNLLLKSEIDQLEDLLVKKQNLIDEIKSYEDQRSSLIQRINQSGIFATTIYKISHLLEAFQGLETEKKHRYLGRHNSLLINIIENIQEQNKKNQIFLNKASASLRELRESFTGKKNYSTYNTKGSTVNRSY